MEYSKEALQNLGIYELRNIARQVGVYSPTTLKKELLIEKVLSVIEGTESPYVRVNKQGRPAKRITGIDDIMEILMPSEMKYNIPKLNIAKETSKLMQNSKVVSGTEKKFCAYVKIDPEQNIILGTKNGYINRNDMTENYFLPSQIISKYELRNGDYICGTFYEASNEKPMYVNKINSINGIIVDDKALERKNFNDLSAEFPKVQINVSNKNSSIDLKIIDKICPIALGSRVIINHDIKPKYDDFAIEIISSINKLNPYNFTYFGVDERTEFINEVKSCVPDMKVFFNTLSMDDMDFIEMLKNAVHHIIREVELGKNHILFIQNLDKFTKFIINDLYLKNKSDYKDCEIRGLNQVVKIFNLAKNTVGAGTLTIIGFNCSNPELLELANCYILKNINFYKDTDISIDVEKSYSIKYDKILSSLETKKLTDFRKNLNKISLIENLHQLFGE